MNKSYEIIRGKLWERGYEICGKIGEGGTAQVYRVRSVMGGEEWACKISGFPERIGPEARLLQQVRHPLFPVWKEYFEMEGMGILIMEYIAGSSLEDHLKRRHVFSQRETVRIALELADGLACLHEREPAVIYRDLKPSNIILQQDGRARLLDLGAAAVPAGWRVGTVGYAAPEQRISAGQRELFRGSGQVSGDLLQPACDVYALAMLMYSMLTGTDPLGVQAGLSECAKYQAGVRVGMKAIIARCLSTCYEERIPGMRELMRELRAYYCKAPLQMLRSDMRLRRRIKVRYTQNIWLSKYK